VPAEPVTVLLLGHGHRGSIYADYARRFPREMRVVAVADSNPHRLQTASDGHGVPPDRRFRHWQEALAQPRLADAVIIATARRPAHRALPARAAQRLPRAAGEAHRAHRGRVPADPGRRARGQADGPRVVGVCHVLRYTPYFRELKALIDSGSIGQVISVQHLEPIEHTHMSHSYVRGAWRNSREATPIILAKSCHDTDIIRWLVGAHAENVHCFGNLKWFTAANAPPGSTERCTDGCKVEPECAYSALKIYYRERKRLYVFDLPRTTRAAGASSSCRA
jgi:predicted dehydrogenase